MNNFVLPKSYHSTFVIIIWICLEIDHKLYDIGVIQKGIMIEKKGDLD